MADRRAIRSRYFQYVVRTDGLESIFDLSQRQTRNSSMSPATSVTAARSWSIAIGSVQRMLETSGPIPA